MRRKDLENSDEETVDLVQGEHDDQQDRHLNEEGNKGIKKNYQRKEQNNRLDEKNSKRQEHRGNLLDRRLWNNQKLLLTHLRGESQRLRMLKD